MQQSLFFLLIALLCVLAIQLGVYPLVPVFVGIISAIVASFLLLEE